MSAHPISFAVMISRPVGDFHGDRYLRAYIDGKRVSLAEARDVSSSFHATVSCMTTERSRDGSRWHFRKVVTL